MTSLELFTGDGDTLADRMRAAVEAEGLLALVGDAKKQVRQALADAVTETSVQTGTAFTARHEGWAAQFTDPQPKPQVTDPQAFGAWAWAQSPHPFPIKLRQQVEVIDHARAVGVVLRYEDGADIPVDEVQGLLDALKVTAEYVLPADPFGPLIDSGRCKIVGAGYDGYALITTETGEEVPGTTVTKRDPELRLTPKGKTERDAAKRDVAEKLGVNLRALEGGDA